MEMKLDVVYKIEKPDSWRGKDSIQIKSNVADDELVSCDIAKSLVEYLKKESAILNPSKLLLGFAEAQRRGIEEVFEGLNDLELRAKNTADSIHEKLLKSYEDAETKYSELEEKFSAVRNKFTEKVNSSRELLQKDIKDVEDLSNKLTKVDNYQLERLSTVLKQILELAEKDSDLMKLVLERRISE